MFTKKQTCFPNCSQTTMENFNHMERLLIKLSISAKTSIMSYHAVDLENSAVEISETNVLSIYSHSFIISKQNAWRLYVFNT